jgi:hypothetical protein
MTEQQARAAAKQHRIYSAQATSIDSEPLRDAHDRLAVDYDHLGQCLDDRADYYAESAKSVGA